MDEWDKKLVNKIAEILEGVDINDLPEIFSQVTHELKRKEHLNDRQRGR
jgi:hypothetical protein